MDRIRNLYSSPCIRLQLNCLYQIQISLNFMTIPYPIIATIMKASFEVAIIKAAKGTPK